MAIFPLFLKDAAIDWFDTLSPDLKNDLDSILENITSYFGKTTFDYVFADETVFTRVQRPNEKTRDYTSQIQNMVKRVPIFRTRYCTGINATFYVDFARGSRLASSHRKETSNM